MIDQRCQPSVALANLIASPWTPLYTAVIILTDSGEKTIHLRLHIHPQELTLVYPQDLLAPRMILLTRLHLISL